MKRIDYDSFGNVIYDSNPSFTVSLGFAGGLYDSDTGLIRFGLRDYDPAVGSWTAKDPIDFAGGDVNLFNYVGNNPVNDIDPLGLAGKGGPRGPIRFPKLPDPGDNTNTGVANFNMGGDWQYGVRKKCKRYSCKSCQEENVTSKDGTVQCHKTKKCQSEDAVPPFIASPDYMGNCVCIEWDVEVYKW